MPVNTEYAHKPVIGITTDVDETGGYSKDPTYAQRQNYCEQVAAAGGIPLILPYHMNLVEHYAQILDGLLITGGKADVPPSFYGHSDTHKTTYLIPEKSEFEAALAKAMFVLDKPILGICGGMQLINVIFGGTLIQHIPDEVSDYLLHDQSYCRYEPGHSIDIVTGTYLHHLTQSNSGAVNSAHHQAVKIVADNFIVNARASDGVIEGIEHKDPHHFVLGVQWHPEFEISTIDKAIFKTFIEASTEYNTPLAAAA